MGICTSFNKDTENFNCQMFAFFFKQLLKNTIYKNYELSTVMPVNCNSLKFSMLATQYKKSEKCQSQSSLTDCQHWKLRWGMTTNKDRFLFTIYYSWEMPFGLNRIFLSTSSGSSQTFESELPQFPFIVVLHKQPFLSRVVKIYTEIPIDIKKLL